MIELKRLAPCATILVFNDTPNRSLVQTHSANLSWVMLKAFLSQNNCIKQQTRLKVKFPETYSVLRQFHCFIVTLSDHSHTSFPSIRRKMLLISIFTHPAASGDRRKNIFLSAWHLFVVAGRGETGGHQRLDLFLGGIVDPGMIHVIFTLSTLMFRSLLRL